MGTYPLAHTGYSQMQIKKANIPTWSTSLDGPLHPHTDTQENTRLAHSVQHFDDVTATSGLKFSPKEPRLKLDESHLQQQDNLHQDNKNALKDCRHPAAHK